MLKNIFPFRITIGKQIFSGFGLVLLLILVQALVSHLGFEHMQQHFTHYIQTNEYVRDIQSMQTNMLDHQRGVLAYTYSGYKGLVNRVLTLEQRLEQQVNDAQHTSTVADETLLLQQIKAQLSLYTDHFKDAIEERIAREQLAYSELIENGSLALSELDKTRTRLVKNGDYSGAILASDVQTQIALIQREALHFLLKPNSRLVRATHHHFARLKSSLQQLSEHRKSQSMGSITSLFKDMTALQTMSHGFEKSFNGMVQASRAYMHLVYVVMGGEAARIGYLAQKLEEASLEEQSRVEHQMSRLVVDTRKMILLVSLLSIVLGIFLASRISRNISRPIEKMTLTLSNLARGHMNSDIPGSGRSDEIGAMAMAANVFREKAHELENVSRYKSEFLANMSHELRTPLNSMLILAKMLAGNESGNLSHEQMQSASLIYDSGIDLLQLINDILDLSKVEAGHMQLYVEDKNFDEFSRIIERLFQPVADQKNLAFGVAIEQTKATRLATDWAKLEQIMRNFLSNAFKFTHTGYVYLSIGLPSSRQLFMNSSLSSGNCLAIAVKDSGIGIPQDKCEHIFEAFRQVDGTTSRKYGGTGLGLSISRRFAELLGGEIQVSSQESKGSTFTLFLPLVFPGDTQSNTVSSDHITSVVSADKAHRLSHSFKDLTRTIMVVDDDHRNVFALKQMLSQRVAKILSAYNGIEALKLLDEHPDVDLILMDIMMPEMDGLQAIEKIRQQIRFNKLPIIALTAKAMPGDKEQCLRAGASEYLAKPVDIDTLLHALKDWLGKPKVHTPSIPINENQNPGSLPKIHIVADQDPEALARNHQHEPLAVSPLKVLIVDDDMRNTYTLAQVLQKKTDKVIIARDGKKAIALLDKEKAVSIILMDIVMPNMDGYETIHFLKNHKQFKYIPIIVLTAKAQPEDREKCLQAGADDYLSKPVEINVLLEKMRFWLKNKTGKKNTIRSND